MKSMLKNWITYYLFLMVTLVLALLYPGRVTSAFFYALLVLPLVSLWLAMLMLAGFKYEQHLDRTTATKGDTVIYRLIAKNKSPLMLPFIEATFHGSEYIFGRDMMARRMAVLPLSKSTLEIKLACRYKGTYEVGLKQIKLRDFLGLYTFKQDVHMLSILTVYPRIIPIDSFPVMAGLSTETQGTAGRSHDNSENVSDIRQYASGDRLRAIHWKLSAKKEELMVKNYEQPCGASADIILDASAVGGTSQQSLAAEDKLVECTVALAYYFATRSLPSTLYYSSSTRLERLALGSIKDFHLAYRMLAETSFSREKNLPWIAGIVHANRKTVVIVSAEITSAIYAEALRLKSSGCMVIIIYVNTTQRKSAAQEDGAHELQESLLLAGVTIQTLGDDDDINTVLSRRAG